MLSAGRTKMSKNRQDFYLERQQANERKKHSSKNDINVCAGTAVPRTLMEGVPGAR